MSAEARRRVLVVEDDPSMHRLIERALAPLGIETAAANTIAEGSAVLAATPMDGVILDLHLTDGDGLTMLEDVRYAHPELPIIVVSRVSDFRTKIESLRHGADAYLEKPIDWEVLARKVESLLETSRTGARILIVEDDPVSAMAMRYVLESAGHRVIVCSEPLQFEKLMVRFRPDLALLDVSLPSVSGLELAQFLRQDSRFEATPVVYVTAVTDPSTAARVTKAGDPVLFKPVRHDVLRATVQAMLDQSRRLRNRMEKDTLTGLLGRGAFVEHLRTAAALSAREPSRDAALAILDLDGFKAVNDRYGHPAGDAVLRNTASLLRRNLRASDVVGRLGGEEFGVLMTNLDEAGAVELMTRMLESFRSTPHEVSPGQSLSLSFSAGVASAVADVDAWISRADEALYQAKKEGRDRVSGWTGPPATGHDDFDARILSGLRQLSGVANRDLLRELVDLFSILAPERIEAITTAAAERDTEGVRRAAHALRGASGNLGVVRMHAICTDLELAAGRTEWETIDGLIVPLRELYASVRPALETLAAGGLAGQRT